MNDIFLFDLYNILGTLLDTTIQLIVWLTREEWIFIFLKAVKQRKYFQIHYEKNKKSIDLEKRGHIDI